MDTWDGGGTLPREPLWTLYLCAAKLGGGLHTADLARLQAEVAAEQAERAVAAAAAADAVAELGQERQLHAETAEVRDSPASPRLAPAIRAFFLENSEFSITLAPHDSSQPHRVAALRAVTRCPPKQISPRLAATAEH